MNISEKSKEYAEGKALNAITTAIEEAYAEGYRTGYREGYDAKSKELPIEQDYGVTYVDLGLPSGTLWSSDFLKDKDGRILYFTFEEAAKLNIPTKEQYKELYENCQIIKREYYKYKGSTILGRNGNSIELKQNVIYTGSACSFQESFTFWLNNGDENTNYRFCAMKNKDSIYSLQFMGCRMPVMIVRH